MPTEQLQPNDIDERIIDAYHSLNVDLEKSQAEASRLNGLRKSDAYRYGVQVTPTEETTEYDIHVDRVEVIIIQNT